MGGKTMKRYIKYTGITLSVFIIVIILQLLIKVYEQFKILGYILIFVTYMIGITATILSSENEKLLDRIFNFTIFIVFNSPLFIYTIALIFKTFSESFIRVGDANVWIGFAGSIIGGSMTMFAIIFTIQNQDNIESKKVIPHLSIDISDFYNIENNLLLTTIRINDEKIQLGGHDSCWINFNLTNNSSHIAKDIKITSIQSINYDQYRHPTYQYQEFEVSNGNKVDLLTDDSKVVIKIIFDHDNYRLCEYFDLLFTTQHTDVFNINIYKSRFLFRFCLVEVQEEYGVHRKLDVSTIKLTESPQIALFSHQRIENSISLESEEDKSKR